MEPLLAWLAVNWQTIFTAFGMVVAAASVVVKATPSLKDDAVLAKVIKMLDWLSIFTAKPPKAP